MSTLEQTRIGLPASTIDAIRTGRAEVHLCLKLRRGELVLSVVTADGDARYWADALDIIPVPLAIHPS